jgi:hypothetical protein
LHSYPKFVVRARPGSRRLATRQCWSIAHYSMSFPVPNELAPAVVEMIRGAAERDG